MSAEGPGGGRPGLASLAVEVAAAPAISACLGRREASLAVPERAQPAALAALARASGRRPLVVCATSEAVAEHLSADLQSWLGADAVVGTRYNAADVMQGVAELLAYGTAVRTTARD